MNRTGCDQCGSRERIVLGSCVVCARCGAVGTREARHPGGRLRPWLTAAMLALSLAVTLWAAIALVMTP